MSHSLKTAVVELYPSLHDMVHVVHNGVSLWWFTGVPKSGDTEGQYVLFVGRLDTVKGLDVLLRAWVIVKDHYPGLPLWIVGDGPQMEHLVRLSITLGVADSVRFVGTRERNELRSLYWGARFLVLPSRNEGLPLVVLEAGACGTLCVATSVGGVPEVIEDRVTGFLVEPESPEAMANVVLKALGLPPDDKRRITAAAKERISRTFSQAKSIGEYEDLFHSLLRRGNSGRRRSGSDQIPASGPNSTNAKLKPVRHQMLRRVLDYHGLPARAKAAYRRDLLGLPFSDPGLSAVIEKGVAWLGLAQDSSSSKDGGVASHYSLSKGWSTSYPETTGYIVPTMLAYAKLHDDCVVRQRARRMLDWLVSIQLPDGGFQGGQAGIAPVVPVTFNTGQILLGLACGTTELGEEYREPMRRAADWLVNTQDSDGCWRKHPTPFASSGEKSYYTHVAWALLEAGMLDHNSDYSNAALANVRWALGQQRPNGWFANCCLSDSSQPLTHTLGYVLRGVLEAYLFTHDDSLLRASCKTAEGILSATRKNGFIPGRLNLDWRGTVSEACLTGSAQIAHCWLILYQLTGEERYRNAAYAANKYLRRTIRVSGPSAIRGAVKGSFPIFGDYFPHAYPSWACKFVIDSNQLEQHIRAGRV